MRLNIGAVDIYYEFGGRVEGDRVLFISGTGGDLRVRPGPFQSPLAARFQLLAYDQRGLGQSSVPPGPYTMADYADDAAGLLEALGWEETAVVGVSFGGMVAQELALRHPGRVRRLVLACTSPGGGGGSSYPLHELAALSVEERIVRSIELSDRRMDEAWRSAHPAEWERAVAMAMARTTVGAGEPDRALGAGLQLQARRGHDAWDRLGAVSCPTLVCGGRYDGIARPENLERLAKAIPGASLEMFEGGNLFLLQDRHAYEAVVSFLEGKG
jgi:3-oxoadipate enol-lactonase